MGTTEFLEHLRRGPVLADGANGSYLFERTGRLSETNHVYEALNVNNPDLVRDVHLAYLEAGARCITTNTFGANTANLTPQGEAYRVADLNTEGVTLAREAVKQFQEQTRAEGPFFVLGSIGPTPTAGEPSDDARRIYAEQVDALAEAGVDALLLETFTSLAHVRALLKTVQSIGPDLPVVAQFTLQRTENGWDRDPVFLTEALADMGVAVVGVNCLAPWDALAFLDAVEQVDAVRNGDILLSAMPNAGGFQRIGHRFMTHVNPEYMGRMARTLAERGARLIGGCCEVHPAHVREMHGYLQMLSAGTRAASSVASLQSRTTLQPAGDAEKRANGPFSAKIKDKRFAVSIEMLPPRGTSGKVVESKVRLIGELIESGLVDAVDITDGSRGIPLVPPGDFIEMVRGRLGWTPASGDGVELIPHFTMRDLNIMGIQARLVGYYHRRIHNVLLVTGDPPKMSPAYPRSTAVFDLDSVGLARYVHSYLNAGADFGGQPLGKQPDPRTHFTIGSGFEPEAVDMEREIERLQRKIDGGVDYVMTQPAFRTEPLAALEPFRDRVAVLVGVMVLTGAEQARRLSQTPGVVIPADTIERLESFEKPDDQAKAGLEIAAEQARWVRREGWAGLYLMSPSSTQAAIDVLGA